MKNSGQRCLKDPFNLLDHSFFFFLPGDREMRWTPGGAARAKVENMELNQLNHHGIMSLRSNSSKQQPGINPLIRSIQMRQ